MLVTRRANRLEALAERIAAAGGVVYPAPCDLSQPPEIERMVADVLGRHGRVDVLVNNAGRSIRRSLELSYDRCHDFDRTIQLNISQAARSLCFLGTLTACADAEVGDGGLTIRREGAVPKSSTR